MFYGRLPFVELQIRQIAFPSEARDDGGAESGCGRETAQSEGSKGRRKVSVNYKGKSHVSF